MKDEHEEGLDEERGHLFQDLEDKRLLDAAVPVKAWRPVLNAAGTHALFSRDPGAGLLPP